MSQENNIPFYVACERSKFISKTWRVKPEANQDPKEVLFEKLDNVEVKNPYYEETPLAFCKGIITNEGIFAPSDVSDFIRQTRISRKLTDRVELFKK